MTESEREKGEVRERGRKREGSDKVRGRKAK